MNHFIFAAATFAFLVGSATGAPISETINFHAAVAPNVPSTSSFLERNENCKVLAENSGALVPGNGTVQAYTDATGILMVAAKKAVTPAGYHHAFFKNTGASQQISGYLTYKETNNPTYDTRQCAEYCDANSDCKAFNIFFERDPLFDLLANPGCDNMKPVTNIKCALYSETMRSEDAVNVMQYDGPNHTGFINVQVGSNGYNKIPKTAMPASGYADALARYKLTERLGNKAILAPNSQSYLGFVGFNDFNYTPGHCAQACDEAKGCVFFNNYKQMVNGNPQGAHCALFSEVLSVEKATNEGYHHVGDRYTIEDSVAYALKE